MIGDAPAPIPSRFGRRPEMNTIANGGHRLSPRAQLGPDLWGRSTA